MLAYDTTNFYTYIASRSRGSSAGAQGSLVSGRICSKASRKAGEVKRSAGKPYSEARMVRSYQLLTAVFGPGSQMR
jgi:hypothetical protein